jgi:hypothetical protein
MIGSLYRRTRVEEGVKVQRAEIRFDDIDPLSGRAPS